ncbi:MAG: hypothetical protein LAN62_12465 [Acidobacteriia bacterium]|nr:hypothetical protein [Terriglobia bacterium]
MATNEAIGKTGVIKHIPVVLTHVARTQPQWLRVRATSPNDPQRLVSQILFWPSAPEPYPGHGFIICFPNATLTDFDANPLFTGFVALRANPDAVSELCLPILSRLLDPLKGDFEMDVQGTYSTDPTTGVTDVVAESVILCTMLPA